MVRALHHSSSRERKRVSAQPSPLWGGSLPLFTENGGIPNLRRCMLRVNGAAHGVDACAQEAPRTRCHCRVLKMRGHERMSGETVCQRLTALCAPGVFAGRGTDEGAQLSDCSPRHASALRWGAMLYRELMECSGDLLCSRYRLDPDADENAESDERGGAKQREVDLFEGAEPTNG